MEYSWYDCLPIRYWNIHNYDLLHFRYWNIHGMIAHLSSVEVFNMMMAYLLGVSLPAQFSGQEKNEMMSIPAMLVRVTTRMSRRDERTPRLFFVVMSPLSTGPVDRATKIVTPEKMVHLEYIN